MPAPALPYTFASETGEVPATQLDTNFTYLLNRTVTADVTGGAINGTVIGGTSPAAGTFTTLTATTLNAPLPDSGVVAGTYGDGSNIPQFTVNSKGVITAATQFVPVGPVAFSVNRNFVDQTGMTAGAFNKVAFNYVLEDSGNYFDTTNNRFLPTVAGWYIIYVSVHSNTSATSSLIAAVYVSGVLKNAGPNSSSTGSSTFTNAVSAMVYLNGVSDYVEGWVQLPTGVTSISGVRPQTYMYGFRLRA